VRDPAAIRNVVSSALGQFGRIDILINNAGIYPRVAFVDMTEQQWDEMQDINLKSIRFERIYLDLSNRRANGTLILEKAGQKARPLDYSSR
jgi:NAD(P)-dependent dehydrogenase (short-subunit alcohol dehydrogenase family)